MRYLDFFRLLCDVWGYRFFVGQPIEGHANLFKYIIPEYMHYLPTISPDITINVAAGVMYGGINSALFIDADDLVLLLPKIAILNNIKEINLLVITNRLVDTEYNTMVLAEHTDSIGELECITNGPNILVVEYGDLHA